MSFIFSMENEISHCKQIQDQFLWMEQQDLINLQNLAQWNPPDNAMCAILSAQSLAALSVKRRCANLVEACAIDARTFFVPSAASPSMSRNGCLKSHCVSSYDLQYDRAFCLSCLDLEKKARSLTAQHRDVSASNPFKPMSQG